MIFNIIYKYQMSAFHPVTFIQSNVNRQKVKCIVIQGGLITKTSSMQNNSKLNMIRYILGTSQAERRLLTITVGGNAFCTKRNVVFLCLSCRCTKAKIRLRIQKKSFNFIQLLNSFNICLFFDSFKPIHSTTSVMLPRSQKKH